MNYRNKSIVLNQKRSAIKKGAPDYFLMTCIWILMIFGLLILASASSVISFQKYGSTYHIFFHQIIVGFLPGLALLYFFYKRDYNKWKSSTFLFFLATFFLLISVFIPGISADFGTAQSWVSIFGVTFQPSEIAKLTFILYLAGWFEDRGYEKIKTFKYGFLPFLAIILFFLSLIAKQPDIGTMMIVTFIIVSMYYVAGARISHLVLFGAGGISALAVIMVKSSYVANRVLAFLHPENDPQNVGYHINQAFLAVGSGGFFGRGFGKSVQKFAYLPEVSSDSIFAIVAEELGFFVSTLLVILLLLIVYRGLRIAVHAPNPYGRLIATGIVSWIVFQAFLNIMVMTGLAPLTGIPFPFISAGGTALAILMGSAGILLNISRYTEV